MFTTLAGVLGSMPGLTREDVDWMQLGWMRVTANGRSAWRTGLNEYVVTDWP